MDIITEIVNIATLEGVSKKDFIEIVAELETNFHSCQKGYIDSELSFNDKSYEWVMIQHWDSIENLKNSSAKMFQQKSTEKFRNSFHPKDIKINIYSQIKTW